MKNNPCSTTTTQLLDALHDMRDGAVWSEFDARYRPIIFGLARRLGLGEADSAEVAQQTLTEFVRDYQSGRYQRDRGRLRAWLIGIARHRAYDVLRGMRRRREYRGDSGYLGIPAPDGLTEIWVAERDRSIALRALDELRATSRTTPNALMAFEMVAIQAMPLEEVARDRGMTVDEVYRVKHRITRRLREIVARLSRCYEESD